MLEFLSGPEDDAITILKNDHNKVKALFERFEETDNLREKKKIAAEAIMELKIHAEIEEKIFYPSVRKDLEEGIMNEADEEHHVAKLLIAELDQMDGSEGHWEAKFIVLAENIRHHIREEEGKMMPEARRQDIDFERIGQKLLAMKQQLKKNGVPPCEEEKLMARSRARADSPAKAAKAKPSLKVVAGKGAKRGLASVGRRASAKKASPSRIAKTKRAASRRRNG